MTLSTEAFFFLLLLAFAGPIFSLLAFAIALWVFGKAGREGGQALALVLQARKLVFDNEAAMMEGVRELNPVIQKLMGTARKLDAKPPTEYSENDLVEGVMAGRDEPDDEPYGEPPPPPYRGESESEPGTFDENNGIPETRPVESEPLIRRVVEAQ